MTQSDRAGDRDAFALGQSRAPLKHGSAPGQADLAVMRVTLTPLFLSSR